MKVLVVEDDQRTADYILKGLQQAGHLVERYADGRDGLTRAVSERFDAIVLDRLLPGLDGMSIIKALRASGNATPVLFLTAVGGLDDRVDGLEAGGDDYLVKPFAFSELLARLSALARRPPIQPERTVLVVADLELDLVARTCRRSKEPIELLPREFALLEFLMRNSGRVVTKTMLLERVWDFHFDPQTSVVETQISRLRAKIDKPFESPLLHTVRSTGYYLDAR